MLDEGFRAQIEQHLFDLYPTKVVRETVGLLRAGDVDAILKDDCNKAVMWAVESTMRGSYLASPGNKAHPRRIRRYLEGIPGKVGLVDHTHPLVRKNAEDALMSLSMYAGGGTARDPLCSCGTGYFDPTPACVYRIFSVDGSLLLYIGKGKHRRRAGQHNREYWWPRGISPVITFEDHDNYDCAGAAEEKAIASEMPIHNVRSNPAAGIL